MGRVPRVSLKHQAHALASGCTKGNGTLLSATCCRSDLGEANLLRGFGEPPLFLPGSEDFAVFKRPVRSRRP